MYSIRNLSIISVSILLILLALSFYHGIFAPPPLITFTTDENFIGESGIFLLFGITPRALEWAALPSTLIAYIMFIGWNGFTLLSEISTIHSLPDILTVFDKNAFYYLNHREEFVIWERWIQLFLVGLIIFKTIWFIMLSNNPILKPVLKFVLVVVIVSADVLWQTVHLIRPEALSGSLFLYLIVRILFTEKITPKIATILLIIFILSFTQRLIFVFFSPFVVGSILINLKTQKVAWKIYSNYFFIVILAFFALMPFIVTNTFVVLKSFLGIIFIKVNHAKMSTYFNMTFINDFISHPVNLLFSIFCLVGMWSLIKLHTSKRIVMLMLANFLFLVFLFLKSAQLYTTHTFPLSVMAVVFVALGFYLVINLLTGTAQKITLSILTLLLLINTVLTVQKNKNGVYGQQRNVANAISWIKSLEPNEKLLLPLDFDGLIAKNKDCLLREYGANESEDYRMKKLSRLLKMPPNDSISKFTLPVMAQSFAFEDEKLFDIQYQIALKYVDGDKTMRYDTDYYFENNNNMSHCLLQKEAIKDFRAGKYRYFISKELLTDLRPIKSFILGGGEIFWAYELRHSK